VIKTRKILFLAALVLVIAVASILVTPDPSDDVDGILRRHKIFNTLEQISTLLTASALRISRSSGPYYLDVSVDSTPQAVFRMICTYRC
jgi:hypothetical protein